MTQNMKARLAGLLYLAGLPTAGFAYGYVAYLPKSDPAALVTTLQAGLGTLRWTILVGVPGFSLLYLIEVLLFRELLKSVCKMTADLMVLLVAASVPLALAALAQRLSLVGLLEAGSPPAADVMRLLQGETSLFQVATIFWGLWLLPLGWLSWRAGLVPRIVAGLLIVAGCLYLWAFAGPLITGPQAPGSASSPLALIMIALTMIGELGFALWLTIFGAKGLKATA